MRRRNWVGIRNGMLHADRAALPMQDPRYVMFAACWMLMSRCASVLSNASENERVPVGFSSSNVDCRMSNAECRVLNIRCRMVDYGLNAVSLTPDTGCWWFTILLDSMIDTCLYSCRTYNDWIKPCLTDRGMSWSLEVDLAGKILALTATDWCRDLVLVLREELVDLDGKRRPDGANGAESQNINCRRRIKRWREPTQNAIKLKMMRTGGIIAGGSESESES